MDRYPAGFYDARAAGANNEGTLPKPNHIEAQCVAKGTLNEDLSVLTYEMYLLQ